MCVMSEVIKERERMRESGCVLCRKKDSQQQRWWGFKGRGRSFVIKWVLKKAKILQGRQLSWTGLRKFIANIKNRTLGSVKLNPSMASHNGKKDSLTYLFS